MAAVTRFANFALFVALAASPLAAQAPQNGSTDPIFSRVPFDRWLSEAGQSQMRWSVRLRDPRLSAHQRFVSGVLVDVDGAELARRRGKGQFLVLVEVRDEKGRVWQNHQEMDLEHVAEGLKGSDAEFSQLFFVLPGDYRVSIAAFADATGDHSVLQRRLHVPSLKNDPLPGAWRALPPVEFIAPLNTPDSWYLPSIEGKLTLSVETREPVHIDLVVNLTPSELFTGSALVQDRTFGTLLPIAKVLSQVDWGRATFSLALLDLSRRRVIWHEENTRGLDWSQAGTSLAEVNPGIIDVKSLEKRQYSAEFFLNQIRQRIFRRSAPRGSRVLIVVSSGIQFASGQQLHPIALDQPSGAHVFYIRYQPPPQIYLGLAGRQRVVPPTARNGIAGFDQLEPLLKPLDPRVFEVYQPEQFRKALAVILAEIAKL